MGKSSSSLKKKHSKKSSKAQKSSKSKSRRYRKKEQRKFDLDDSTSFSSSSEDSYRVKRVQTHTKREVKGRRKRAQKRSYSSGSSEDSLRVRKRKRSKRKNDYEVKEKRYKKKKIRREASVSSLSNRSQSCSTCRGGTASSDDSELENHRGRSGRKEDNRRLERGRSGSRKSGRYRARSCSSCSQGRESFDERSEEYMIENNSRRLRSIITVTNKDEEGGELCRSQYKEEIVDDHDYPCRSNDSNDGASKRELDHGSLPALEEKVRVEDEKGGAGDGFGSTRDWSHYDGNQYNRSNVHVAGTSESIEKITSENSGGSLNGNDLESILRQRALENLRKFRGEIQSTEKAFDQKNKLASVRPPLVIKNYEQIVANTINNNVSVGANCDKETLLDETSRPAQKSLNGNKGKLESAKVHSIFALEKVIDADSETSPASIGYITNNPESITSESCHHSLKNCSSLKQKHAAGPHQEKLVVTESTIGKCTFDSAQVFSCASNDNVKNVRGLQSAAEKPSCPIPIVRNNNLNKGQDEVKEDSQVELKQNFASHELPDSKPLLTKSDVDENSAMDATAIQSVNNNLRDNSVSGESGANKSQDEASQGSHFEQKTMNVMRGGEMVQVSYKVYIPTKAPALARRQLKR